ncbi:uncharacterized protein LOC144623331 [Crassostrea virginica]
MQQPSVIATIQTSYNVLGGVECIGDAEAWIFGNNNTITQIDIDGTVKETVTTACQNGPDGISFTKTRELIYSDSNSRTVNIVRQGKSETLITTPPGWIPWKLYSTRAGDILVHVHEEELSYNRKNEIIRYKGQEIIQPIYRDGQNNPIVGDGVCARFMSENKNEDICVSNIYLRTVVCMDRAGRVRFRYDGSPARREKSFGPRGIVTDALSRIIVADIHNNCLHILDQDGQFLKCVDDCQLEEPSNLSVDTRGRLWVGCAGGKIKVIQYFNSLLTKIVKALATCQH